MSNDLLVIGLIISVFLFLGAFMLSRSKNKNILLIFAVALGIIIVAAELYFYIAKPTF